jgi:hypothetical protein
MNVKITSTTNRYWRHCMLKMKKLWVHVLLATVGPVLRVEPAIAPRQPANNRSIPTVSIASFMF